MFGGYGMSTDAQCAVWDACVIIDAIQKTPGRYEMMEGFLMAAERGEFRIVISEGSVGEASCLGGLETEGASKAEQRHMIEAWLENPYIIRRTVHPGISRLAAELGDKYRIKRLGDRLVVATAVLDGIPTLHTFDGYGESKPGLLALDGVIGNPPLHIEIPDYGKGTLFGAANDG